MEIAANSIKLEDDGYCTILAFADDPADPQNYVILQVINNPSPQDIRLGQDGVHFEFGGQEASGYNLLKAIETKADEVLLSIDEGVAQRMSIDARLIIKVGKNSIDSFSLEKAVQIFQARLPHG